ncbi:MAG: DNA repair protein RecO [Anaerolineae bacterium]|nr:DNA repair protein RecO [Anaerolineae bacterium]
MKEQRLYRSEAIVLRERDYGEADRILTLLTPGGKISALAKGIRRATSRKVGHLGLFYRAQVLLARGRNFHIVSQAECLEEYEGLRGDLSRFGYACTMGELMDRFAQEGEENEALYELMARGLRWCAQESDLRLWMRYFELHLLSLAGYQPQLFACVGCHEPIRPEANFFTAEGGGLLCARCGEHEAQATPVSINAQKVLRFLMSHSPEVARTLRVHASTHRELEALLQHYLEYVLEREVRSTRVLRRMEREMHVIPTHDPPGDLPPTEGSL